MSLVSMNSNTSPEGSLKAGLAWAEAGGGVVGSAKHFHFCGNTVLYILARNY
jgi:phage FluMu gp28-like protein